MKKSSFIHTAFLVFLIAGNSIAYGQSNENDIVSLSPSRKPKADLISGSVTGPAEKALAAFGQLFANATNVSWATEKKRASDCIFRDTRQEKQGRF